MIYFWATVVAQPSYSKKVCPKIGISKQTDKSVTF